MCEVPCPQWVDLGSSLSVLMLGRIELAHIWLISGGAWTVKRRFYREGEDQFMTAPTQDDARRIAEKHARRVLTNA